MDKRKCPNCKKKYEPKPHQRTALCNWCYYEKRLKDKRGFMQKVRAAIKAKKPKKINYWLQQVIDKFAQYDIKVVDYVLDDGKGGYLDLEGEIRFLSIPAIINTWSVEYLSKANITRLSYKYNLDFRINQENDPKEKGTRINICMNYGLYDWLYWSNGNQLVKVN